MSDLHPVIQQLLLNFESYMRSQIVIPIDITYNLELAGGESGGISLTDPTILTHRITLVSFANYMFDAAVTNSHLINLISQISESLHDAEASNFTKLANILEQIDNKIICSLKVTEAELQLISLISEHLKDNYWPESTEGERLASELNIQHTNLISYGLNCIKDIRLAQERGFKMMRDESLGYMDNIGFKVAMSALNMKMTPLGYDQLRAVSRQVMLRHLQEVPTSVQIYIIEMFYINGIIKLRAIVSNFASELAIDPQKTISKILSLIEAEHDLTGLHFLPDKLLLNLLEEGNGLTHFNRATENLIDPVPFERFAHSVLLELGELDSQSLR